MYCRKNITKGSVQLDRILLTAAVFVWGASFVWVLVTGFLARMQPRKRRLNQSPLELGPVSIVVPTSATGDARAAAERKRTLASLLALEYPVFEIIVCFDRGGEDAAVIHDLRRSFSDDRVRIVVAQSQVSANGKVNAMITGVEYAKHQLVLFSDDDVLVYPDHLLRMLAQRRPGIGLVSAAAIGVEPANLWAELELSFMNVQFGRLHLAGDFLGVGGVLGKSILLYRDDIRRAGGLFAIGNDCCEDAALTRNFAVNHMRTALGDRPVLQPMGRQRFVDVWRRHRRWLMCRRKYIPFTFLCEALLCGPAACAGGAVACSQIGINPTYGAIVTAVLWALMDALFVVTGGGRYGARVALAWFIREIIFLPVWMSALFARTVRWHGRRL
jgi:ceramide glucosyltransferase